MNSKAVRVLVVAEVLVCFVPLAGLLLAGFLFSLFTVGDMLKGRPADVASLVAVACGVAGFAALFQVLRWLFGRQEDVLGRWWTLAFMLLGLLPFVVPLVAALIAVLSGQDGDWHRDWYILPFLAVPVLVTAHLAYLARQYLFTSSGIRVRP